MTGPRIPGEFCSSGKPRNVGSACLQCDDPGCAYYEPAVTVAGVARLLRGVADEIERNRDRFREAGQLLRAVGLTDAAVALHARIVDLTEGSRS